MAVGICPAPWSLSTRSTILLVRSSTTWFVSRASVFSRKTISGAKFDGAILFRKRPSARMTVQRTVAALCRFPVVALSTQHLEIGLVASSPSPSRDTMIYFNSLSLYLNRLAAYRATGALLKGYLARFAGGDRLARLALGSHRQMDELVLAPDLN